MNKNIMLIMILGVSFGFTAMIGNVMGGLLVEHYRTIAKETICE